MLETITNIIVIINIIILPIVIYGGYKMFGRKNIKETPEYKAQLEEANKKEPTVMETPVSRNPFIKKQEPPPAVVQPTTEEVIAGETELWYKAQVLEMLAEILQRLRKYD